MKDEIFGVLQRVGRSFMLPIAILPVAGLFLGIGGSFTNANMIEAYGLTGILGEGTFLYAILSVLNKCGDIVFANLPILFAMGVAIGMAKKEKEVAVLAAAIAFFIMHSAIGAMLSVTDAAQTLPNGSITSVVGIESLQMGVFGGIIVGLGVAALHNRFYRIELPQVLSFFGGTRFVPIISTIVYMFVGILMFFVWPVVQNGIYALGGLVTGSGYVGTLIFGLIKRALIPFGLHHVFYMPFWQTAVGGTMEVAGQMVQGGQNIFFAQLADQIGAQTLADGLDAIGFNSTLPFELTLTQSSYGERLNDAQTLAATGYGQGDLLINPVHMTALYTAYVNEGSILQPYLIYADGERKIYKEDAYSADTAQTLLEDLRQTMSSYGDNPTNAAGKTGSAEVDNGAEVIGWTCAVNEQAALTVMMENTKEEGSSLYVQPIAAQMLEAISE